jgi:hypothetical protein
VVEELITLAANMALELAGIPTPMVMDAIVRFADTLREEFVDSVGAEGAELISSSFTKAVLEAKAEIENAGKVTLQ